MSKRRLAEADQACPALRCSVISVCPDLIIDCGSIAGDLLSGEFLKFIKELRSYEMRVPPGVVPYREPPGVDDSGIIWPV